MGVLRRVGRRVLNRVAEQVARNDLFEKPGERSWQGPLPMHARAGSAAEARPAGPALVHHWATWCEPCEQELPLVERLAKELPDGISVLGVSWDRFQDDGPLARTLERVEAMAQKQGVSWPTLVLTDGPEESFEALGLDHHTVPQTLLVGADGSVLHHVRGPLDEASIAALKARL